MAGSVSRTVVKARVAALAAFRGDLLIIGVYQDLKRLPRQLTDLDKAVGGRLAELLKLGDFEGKQLQLTAVYGGGKIKRVMLAGLGEKKDLTAETIRRVAGAAVRRAGELKAGAIGFSLPLALPGKIDAELASQAITEGLIVGRYSFDEYISDDDAKSAGKMPVSLLADDEGTVSKLRKGIKIGTILAEGQNRSRAIANQPGNSVNPQALAAEARRLARKFGLSCTVFDDRKLAQMKMGGILAVGGGSASKPRLIVLRYKGKRSAGIDVVVVGKAITFDSGGINLKPSGALDGMKFDKSGGCAILGIMTALAELRLTINVVGVIPAAENMVSQTSYRPDDIVRTYSGKTVEIQNTDAEGRIILSDALAYAAEMKPAAIIDMATLTGACVIALGNHKSGLFANNDDLRKKIESAAQASGEAVWHLPSSDEYLEQMKSKVADFRNVGGREGGSCTAAAFLHQFVGEVPHAHIDIAGTADSKEAKPYRAVGSTGTPVRLVLEYLRSL